MSNSIILTILKNDESYIKIYWKQEYNEILLQIYEILRFEDNKHFLSYLVVFVLRK